jgi:hypothetical protein
MYCPECGYTRKPSETAPAGHQGGVGTPTLPVQEIIRQAMS